MKGKLLIQLVGWFIYCQLSAKDAFIISTTEAYKNIVHLDTLQNGLKILFVDFGTYNISDTKKIDVFVKNISDSAVSIINASWGEPMFIVMYDKKICYPGETAVLHYVNLYKHEGPFAKTSTVTFDNNTQLLVRFIGYINPDVTKKADENIRKW
ncbi:MAG: hypothetical protein U0U67_12365 [Chitinophagales bacterium]